MSLICDCSHGGLRFGIVVIISCQAEDFIDIADNGATLFVGKFAPGILESLKGGAGLDAGFAIFLDEHCFPAGASQSIYQANKSGGIAAQVQVELGAVVMAIFDS